MLLLFDRERVKDNQGWREKKRERGSERGREGDRGGRQRKRQETKRGRKREREVGAIKETLRTLVLRDRGQDWFYSLQLGLKWNLEFRF